MRKLLLFAVAFLPLVASAQLATFEHQPLSKADTFYINKTDTTLKDVGFNDSSIHFPYVWDTSYGGGWGSGFSYSNKKDSVKSGYTNQYAAKAAGGYAGSNNYVVYWEGYGTPESISITQKKSFTPQGFYYTNSTYAYNSMRDGDGFAKKFGGTSGNDTDWFKVTVHAYLHGVVKPDSVSFYLADFRFANNAQDYIVKDWRFVNLSTLGTVDSFFFKLSSSDNNSFGMLTPAYFCLDNVSVTLPVTGVGNTPNALIGAIYPNPAKDQLFVEIKDASVTSVSITDASGRIVAQQSVTGDKLLFNTANFVPGFYSVRLEGAKGIASTRFIKQ